MPNFLPVAFKSRAKTPSGFCVDLLSTGRRAAADVIAPTLSSTTIAANGLTLTRVFSEACNGHTGFTLTASDGPVTETYVSGEGTATFVSTLSREVSNTETVTQGYVAGNVEDLLGNDLATIVAGSVTNSSAVAGFVGTRLYVDTDATDAVVTGGTITASSDVYTKTAHGFHTGERVLLNSLTGGTGLTAGNTYYVNVLSANTAELCSTLANAVAGTQIDVTVDASAVSLTHLGFTRGTGAIDSKWGSLREALWNSATNTAMASTAVKIICVGVSADTNICSQTTWDNITNCTAAHYLQVWGDNRSGKYNTNAYRGEPEAASAFVYNNKPAFVWFYYLQGKIVSNTAASMPCFRLTSSNVGAGGSGYDCGFFGVIAQLVKNSTGRLYGFQDDQYNGTGTCKRINCIVYETGSSPGCFGYVGALNGITNDSCLADVDYEGFEDDGGSHTIVLNCVALRKSTAFNHWQGTFHASSNYNADEDVDCTAPGANAKNYADDSLRIGGATFVDYAGKDFHLVPTDTKLKGWGSTTQTLDIDGQTRGTPDDIGPDDQQ